jgi:hypothetical protein
VVTSSNNGAVENVSLELPKQSAIHDVWSASVDVSRDIASTLLGEPAWAMIAGRLDNKDNRTDCMKTFWWQKSEGGMKVPGLCERLRAIKRGESSPKIPWQEAVDAFRQALSEEQAWRTRLADLHDIPAKCRAALNSRNCLQDDELLQLNPGILDSRCN